MSDMNDVLSKVKKLLALSSSSNEAEAALALEKAHHLLKEHNLSMNQIEKDTLYDIKETVFHSFTNESKWKTVIIMGVAKANYCDTLTRTYGKHKESIIIGKEHNILVAVEITKYLIDTVERLCKVLPANMRVSYKNGIAYRLYQRLEDSLKKEKVECTALVVQEEKMVDAYMKTLNCTTKEVGLYSSNSSAYYRGIHDGDNVSLNPQVKGNMSGSLIQ